HRPPGRRPRAGRPAPPRPARRRPRGRLVTDAEVVTAPEPGAEALPSRRVDGPVRSLRARAVGAGIVVATFVAVVVSMVRNGAGLTGAMRVRTWQLSDTALLADDPIGTTWYLQVQPPLYDLFVGSVLRWSPFPVIGTLYVLYLAAVLAIGLLVWDLLVR